MAEKKKYKAVFLDWDDTIGDWIRSAYLAQQDLFNHYRLGEFFTDFEKYFDQYESHNLELWRRYGLGEITKEFLQRDRFLYPITQALGGSETLYRSENMVRLADQIGKDFLRLTNQYFSLLPDADEVVRYLAAKYPLTIISNGFGEVQHYKIAHSGLKDCFAHILLSEEVGINKPQPGIYEEALKRNDISPNEAVMIGDSYNSDISGAKAAGIDQIWIRRPLSDTPAGDGQRTATYEVTKLRDVMELL